MTPVEIIELRAMLRAQSVAAAAAARPRLGARVRGLFGRGPAPASAAAGVPPAFAQTPAFVAADPVALGALPGPPPIDPPLFGRREAEGAALPAEPAPLAAPTPPAAQSASAPAPPAPSPPPRPRLHLRLRDDFDAETPFLPEDLADEVAAQPRRRALASPFFAPEPAPLPEPTPELPTAASPPQRLLAGLLEAVEAEHAGLLAVLRAA